MKLACQLIADRARFDAGFVTLNDVLRKGLRKEEVIYIILHNLTFRIYAHERIER
jgi:hypothetical protein